MLDGCTKSTNTEQSSPCVRCHVIKAQHVVRSENLCSGCFAHYIGSKVVKRMDGYKVRGSTTRKVLLPLSLGPTSMVLLYMLDKQLQGQLERTGRVGYEISVLHIDESRTAGDSAIVAINVNKIKKVFPNYDYHTLSINAVLQNPEEIFKCEGSADLMSSATLSLSKVLPNLTPTSYTDLSTMLRTRLITDTANILGCSSITWGDSATRLAERVLSETAKGRGFAIPDIVGESAVRNGISCIFPMRDLLRREIDEYLHILTPKLEALLGKENDSVKNHSLVNISLPSRDTAIEQLLGQYFSSVEQSYPSVVANVVRTSSRLVFPESDIQKERCGLCGLSTLDGTSGLQGWGGEQALRDEHGQEREQKGGCKNGVICYGCTRSLDGFNIMKKWQ